MRKPSLLHINDIIKNDCQEQINGYWYPARPEVLEGRFKIAWMVLTGKADAVIWPTIKEKENVR